MDDEIKTEELNKQAESSDQDKNPTMIAADGRESDAAHSEETDHVSDGRQPVTAGEAINGREQIPADEHASDAEQQAGGQGQSAETRRAPKPRPQTTQSAAVTDGDDDLADDDLADDDDLTFGDEQENLRDTGWLSKIIRRADRSEKKKKRKKDREPLAVRLHTQEENEADKQRFLKLPAHLLSYLLIVGAVLLIVFLISFISGHWQYRNYHVISSRTQEATVSASYANVDGDILRYSTDGASLLDSSGEVLWDVSYNMSSPDIALRGNTIAIYDTAGSSIVVCDRTGQIGSANASYPIKKAEVSSAGNVAAIEEDGATTYIEYYAVSGTQIAEIKTSIDNPGYPLDLALSEDGQLISVSYLTYEGSTQKDVIDVYSFGAAGQDQMDNRIGEFSYTDRIIPDLVYLQGSTLAAFFDGGFLVLNGANVPEETRAVQIDDQIASVFSDSAHIGVITGTGSTHRLLVYTTEGRKITDRTFEYAYNDMDYAAGEVTLYNDNNFCVYNLSGICKFNGSYTGTITDIFAIGRYRYGVVKDAGIDQIQLG